MNRRGARSAARAGALGWSVLAIVVSACGESRQSPSTAPTPVPGATIIQLSIAQVSLAGGQSTEGTVTLSGAAPPGVSVTLSSSHAAVVVPGTVPVSTGATSATFPITTHAVTSMTEVSITATLGSSTRTTVLRVNLPGPRIVSLTVDSSVAGGQTPSASVELDTAAPVGGVAVALSSDNDAARVPATITVPAGAARATFAIPTQGVSSEVRATIFATLGGESRSATVLIRVAVLRALTVEPSVTGGNAAAGEIHFDGAAPAGGVTVALSSSSTSATVPSSVQVPAGGTGATFSISTRSVIRLSFVQITASFGGVSLAATLELLPP
jgi:hypothetical protein